MNHSGLNHYIGSTLMAIVVLCLLSASFGYAETIYVNSGATGADDGTSWNDAYIDLQAAIDAATPGDEVWVAAGIYRPTSWPNGGSDDRERHFSLKNGVSIYGGFAGAETSLHERDVETNETILSGDIGTDGDDSDNCYHVFYHPEGTDLDTTAVLDSVIITGGHAGGHAGYFRDPHYEGGGIYNYSSSPLLANCTFTGNSADYGGGIYNLYSSPSLINCTFSDNSAEYSYIECSVWKTCLTYYDGGGGGMDNNSSSPNLANCTFSGNWAYYGGGMRNWNSSPTLTNCILWNNGAYNLGNEVYNDRSTQIFYHCDVKGSFVDGVWDEELGTDGGNNIDADPLFVRNPGTDGEDDPGDLHLTPDSPCIDAGDPSVPDGQDMDGEVRVFDGDEDGIAIIDMGADEYVDSDYDGIDDNSDLCPEDFAKTDPGICGCGVPDMDTDEDGTFDCDELPGVIATTISGNTGEDGTSTTLDVRLDSPPNGDVILLVESTDDSEGTVSPITLTFTTLNWSTNQTVTVTGVDDDIEDGDQPYIIQISVDIENTQDSTGYLDLDAVDISMTNVDDGNDGLGDGGVSNGGDGGTAGPDNGDDGTGGSNGGRVSSEGGSSGGCFINSLSGAGE